MFDYKNWKDFKNNDDWLKKFSGGQTNYHLYGKTAYVTNVDKYNFFWRNLSSNFWWRETDTFILLGLTSLCRLSNTLLPVLPVSEEEHLLPRVSVVHLLDLLQRFVFFRAACSSSILWKSVGHWSSSHGRWRAPCSWVGDVVSTLSTTYAVLGKAVTGKFLVASFGGGGFSVIFWQFEW